MDTNKGISSDDRRTIAKTVIGLVCVITVAVLNLVWLWGLLFSVWAVSGLLAGRAYLIEELSQENFPILCWAINIVWLLIGLSMMFEPLLSKTPSPCDFADAADAATASVRVPGALV